MYTKMVPLKVQHINKTNPYSGAIYCISVEKNVFGCLNAQSKNIHTNIQIPFSLQYSTQNMQICV